MIDKSTYEIKFLELSKALQKLKVEKVGIDASAENSINNRKRLNDFRKVFDTNKRITEFDRVVFESAVSEIILCGTDDEDKVDPYMLTFIFDAGMSHSIKGKDVVALNKDKNNKESCSYTETDTCRVRCVDGKYVIF